MQSETRINEARQILNLMGVNDPVYLGLGCEGVVFHNDHFVYKVYDH